MAEQYREGDILDGSDGKTYIVQNGVPVLMGGGAQGMQIAPADPMVPIQRMQAQLAVQKTAADLARAPLDTRKAVADASKAEAEAAEAQRKLADKPAANTAQTEMMKSLSNDEVLGALDRARKQIGGFSTGVAGQVLARFGGTDARDLKGTLSTIGSRITRDVLSELKSQSATGASGFGALSEREGDLLRDSVASLDQAQSEDQLRSSLADVEKHYRNVRAIMNNEDPRKPDVAKRYGIAALPGAAGTSGGASPGSGGNGGSSPGGDGPVPQDSGLGRGGYNVESDPTLKGVNGKIRSMIGQGRSAAEIAGFMNSVKPGLGDQRMGDVAAAVDFRKQNPNVPLEAYQVSVESRAVPISSTRSMINNVAQSGTGAFLANVGNAATGFNLDKLTDNPALARAGMSAVNEMNPTASVAGTLAGGALSGAAAEGALGRFGVPLAGRALGADALFGGLSGAGVDENDRLGGFLKGAGVGVVGGMAGRRLTGGAGAVLRGVQNPSAQALRAADVPLTVGQALGGRAKAREDRLMGFLGIGDRIIAQRRGGLQSFNTAAFREGLAPIGGQVANNVGEQAVEAGQDAVSDAYGRTLGGVRIPRALADPQMGAEIAAANARGSAIPNLGPEYTHVVNTRVGPYFEQGTGDLTGDNFQAILQGLRKARSDYAKNPNVTLKDDITGSLGDVEGAVSDMVTRQRPEVVEGLTNANTAYRNMSVLEDATLRGINTGGIFTPAQLGMAAKANTIKYGGKRAAARGDRPFFELQRAGQEVLPSSVPDSGTAGRIEAGGGPVAQAKAMLRNATLAPLYSDTTQEALNRLLLDRSASAVRAGRLLQEQQRIAGLLGRAGAANYAYGQ